MPAQFGPGTVPSVAKDIFQTFLMAAMSTRQMLSLIRRGEGETIHVTLESKANSIRLPVFPEEEDFYTYIRRQLEDLCACEHMLVKRKEPCTSCTNHPTQQPQSTNNEEANNTVEEKRRWSPSIQQNLTSTTPQQNLTSSTTSQQHVQHVQHAQHVQQTNVQSTDNSTLSSPTPPKQPRKSVPGKYFTFSIKFYYMNNVIDCTINCKNVC